MKTRINKSVESMEEDDLCFLTLNQTHSEISYLYLYIEALQEREREREREGERERDFLKLKYIDKRNTLESPINSSMSLYTVLLSTNDCDSELVLFLL